jgi:transposase InsO family protein
VGAPKCGIRRTGQIIGTATGQHKWIMLSVKQSRSLLAGRPRACGLHERRGKPIALNCDKGPEYISRVLLEWANQDQITLLNIRPGKPTQNAYVERFNGTARNEWLELNIFEDLEHAQLLATQWQWTYNNERPHPSIGGVPPRQLL